MTRPNILCISIDSARADYCSFVAESQHNTTPFLQSLSTESAVFRSAISPSIWTLPVHASVFTGLYPPKHGVLTGAEALKNKTFAEYLSEEGYSTQAFHQCPWLDTADLLRGFDIGQNEYTRSEQTRKAWIADAAQKLSPHAKNFLKHLYEFKKYRIDLMREGIELYREWTEPAPNRLQKDTNGGRTIERAISSLDSTEPPFCWFLWLGDAHWKYKPPNPYHQSFTDRSVFGLVRNYVWWQHRVYGTPTNRLKTVAGEIDPPSHEVRTFENLYRGCLKYCDSLVKELVDGLKNAGHWENTVLIVFGDHGDGFGENGVFGHHFSVGDSLIRVPLLIRDPTGRLEPGSRSYPTSLIDIYPTVFDLANIAAPESSGINLAEESREVAYTYYDVTDCDHYTKAPERGVNKSDLPPAKQFAIWRSENEKVTYFPDRGEYVKIGPDDGSLRSRLKEHTEQLGEVNMNKDEISDRVTQRLKDMGYRE